MARSEATPTRLGPVRRPLQDLPNNLGVLRTGISGKTATDGGNVGVRVSKSEMNNKVPRRSATVVEARKDDSEDCLDRLLHVHSDLASLNRQIDELVARAFKLKSNGEEGRREIESFSHFLSDTLSSFKPWVSRFEKALATPPLEPDNQLEKPPVEETASPVTEESLQSESPGESEMDFLISPSPLVSWRADCNIDRTRQQLFLLTPLPMSKTLSTKRLQQLLPATALEKSMAPDSTATELLPSFLAISGEDNDDLLEGVKINPTPSKPCGSVPSEGNNNSSSSNSESGSVFSTPMISNKGHRSMLVMTPCLKTSPPKSCLLLEPIAEVPHKTSYLTRQSTPYPVGLHSQVWESESSSGSEASKDLGVRYPELLGIQWAAKSSINGQKDLEKSPEWSFSPLKTCTLLPPSDQNSMAAAEPSSDQELVGSRRCQVEIEKTPACKFPESTVRRGGKNPGETTLKRELWTKFEAVTTSGLRLNASAIVRGSRKGFLDMLDEVSYEERTES
ncbi:unnamed protein product [Linum trigynum]|uniref:Uncharacterized protein n=1 Tax=Linum trigynum TaxID=586398 RepID=A0AAV2DY55_9ROSI